MVWNVWETGVLSSSVCNVDMVHDVDVDDEVVDVDDEDFVGEVKLVAVVVEHAIVVLAVCPPVLRMNTNLSCLHLQ
jgi:hypothetical protein